MRSPRLLRLAALVAVASVSLRVAAFAQEDETNSDDPAKATGTIRNPGTRSAAADIAAASDEGTRALARMKLPTGLVAKLWAAEPMLANPVAFNFDERGRIFVAEDLPLPHQRPRYPRLHVDA